MGTRSSRTPESRKRKKKSRKSKLALLEDPLQAGLKLQSGQELTPDESEAYLNLALANWLLQTPLSSKSKLISEKLAVALSLTHHDRWLNDFILSPSSPLGDRLLLKAITVNHHGDTDEAEKAAALAAREFSRVGNRAGVLRSRFEQVYALRRSSNAQAYCNSALSLRRDLRSVQYLWIAAQNLIELSSCEIMKNSHDRSILFARRAQAVAIHASYPILQLRALGLQGNLDLYAGRDETTWVEDEEGLRLFWQGSYPEERAFQFYRDLQVSAEVDSRDILALLLQREALSMIEGHGRDDFEAMAHLLMAEAEQILGNNREAQGELAAYQSVINRLPASSAARQVYEAYSHVSFARLALRLGHSSEAADDLSKAARLVETSKNAIFRLDYLQALAESDQQSSNVNGEIQDLTAIRGVIEQELKNTSSLQDRWYMRRALERSQRRLLEIRIATPHDGMETFAEWHFWRTIYNGRSPSTILFTPRNWAERQLHVWQSQTLVSFAVLPHAVIVWIFRDGSLQERILSLEESRLRKEVMHFYGLCSNPDSDLKEVNASGSRLYEMLIAPLELKQPDQPVYIDADSFLSFVPWSALRTKEGQYWGLEQSIVVHTGFGWNRMNGNETNLRGKLRRILAVAPGAVDADNANLPPLPSAQEEVRFIHSLFPETKILRSGAATSSRVRSELRNSDALHFAGHAIDREDGGELLTDPAEAPGMISAAGLSETFMPHVQLVVLSACSGAAPGPDADRRPEGLVRAFVEHGVPRVIASRWDVDSSATAGMMRDFYSFLKGGSGAEQALRGAEQDLARNKAYAHPYYWSGFQEFTGN